MDNTDSATSPSTKQNIFTDDDCVHDRWLVFGTLVSARAMTVQLINMNSYRASARNSLFTNSVLIKVLISLYFIQSTDFLCLFILNLLDEQ